MEQNRWDLTRIYADEDAFLKDLEEVKTKLIPSYETVKGKLGTEEGFKRYLDLEREADLKISHLRKNN